MLDVEAATCPPFPLPAGACDCHMHVFGDSADYPLSAFRSYSVGPATLEEYRRLQARTGLSRVVFVQAAGYDRDNRCMLEALAASGASARGIAVIDEQFSRGELERMHAVGVRGIRVNLVSVGTFTSREAAERLTRLARVVAELGWHVQVFADQQQLPELAPLLDSLPVPVIVDHMGLPVSSEGIAQEGFSALLRLVAGGRCWAKLSGADRITRGEEDMTGAGKFARALIAENPENLVWGSDWPHIPWHGREVHSPVEVVPFRDVDERLLLSLLAQWAPDPVVLSKILTENPARLYGF